MSKTTLGLAVLFFSSRNTTTRQEPDKTKNKTKVRDFLVTTVTFEGTKYLNLNIFLQFYNITYIQFLSHKTSFSIVECIPGLVPAQSIVKIWHFYTSIGAFFKCRSKTKEILNCSGIFANWIFISPSNKAFWNTSVILNVVAASVKWLNSLPFARTLDWRRYKKNCFYFGLMTSL